MQNLVSSRAKLRRAFALLLAAGCDPSTFGPSTPSWQIVHEQLPSGLLAVSGTAPDDVFIVGTDAGDGNGPLVARYDGQAWHRLHTGTTGDLWWITAEPIDGDFYISGENGTILRFDPESDSFEEQTTPGDETIFGVWGPSAADIWAVGGLLDNQQFGGVIWHFDGASWQPEDLTSLFPTGHPTVLKIWGRGSDDVYAVGSSGLILYWDGNAWMQLDNGLTSSPPLFSVYGNDQMVVAVGGFNSGFILERESGDFTNRSAAGTIQMNGVYLLADGSGAAVGRELNVALRIEGQWQVQQTDLPADLDFHANWIDSEGGVWAVGGNLVSEPIDQGILVYYGPRQISSGFAAP